MSWQHMGLVFLGGGLGSLVRFLLARIIPAHLFNIPMPILVVNVMGCFLIGVISEVLIFSSFKTYELRIFLITGFLGGFTTFSSFALEFANLIEKKTANFEAILYLALSVFISISVFFLGMKITKSLYI